MPMFDGTPEEGQLYFKKVLDFIMKPEFADAYDLIGADSLPPEDRKRLYEFLGPKIMYMAQPTGADIVKDILERLNLMEDSRINDKVEPMLNATTYTVGQIAIMNVWFGITVGLCMAGTKMKKKKAAIKK
jgi:hypothetical protein